MKRKPRNRKNRIITAVEERMECMLVGHDEVRAVRLDLRFPVGHDGGAKNTLLSEAMEQFRKEADYGPRRSAYVAAREKNKGDNHHYHALIIIDGGLEGGSRDVHAKLDLAWCEALDTNGKGLVHRCQSRERGFHDNGILVKKPSPTSKGKRREKEEAAFQKQMDEIRRCADYIAKSKTKGKVKKGVREFMCSRLPKGWKD